MTYVFLNMIPPKNRICDGMPFFPIALPAPYPEPEPK